MCNQFNIARHLHVLIRHVQYDMKGHTVQKRGDDAAADDDDDNDGSVWMPSLRSVRHR